MEKKNLRFLCFLLLTTILMGNFQAAVTPQVALLTGAKTGNKPAVEKALEELKCKKVDINEIKSATGKYRSNPLHIAAFEGHFDIVKTLVDAGAKTDYPDGIRCTALQGSSFRGHKDIVQYLLANNPAMIDGQDQQGNTALHWAARMGHGTEMNWNDIVKGNIDVIRLLLQAKANPNIKNRQGETALQIAEKYAAKNPVNAEEQKMLAELRARTTQESHSYLGTGFLAVMVATPLFFAGQYLLKKYRRKQQLTALNEKLRKKQINQADYKKERAKLGL